MLGLKISHITIPLGHPGLDSSSESVRADRRAAQGRGCPNSTGVAWGVPGTHVAGPRPEVQTPGDRWGRLRVCVSDETPRPRRGGRCRPGDHAPSGKRAEAEGPRGRGADPGALALRGLGPRPASRGTSVCVSRRSRAAAGGGASWRPPEGRHALTRRRVGLAAAPLLRLNLGRGPGVRASAPRL